LKVGAWFDAVPGGAELATRRFRQLDKALTSVVLNMAEGNGRRMEADHLNWTKCEIKCGIYDPFEKSPPSGAGKPAAGGQGCPRSNLQGKKMQSGAKVIFCAGF